MHYLKYQAFTESEMPTQKYYCDYCDKQFQDTPVARKRHLEGFQHKTAKKLWYDSFKDPQQLNAEKFGRGVCVHFVRKGFCQYGDNCRYFHPIQNVQQYYGGSMPGVNYSNMQMTTATSSQPLIATTNMQSTTALPGIHGSLPTNRSSISHMNLPPSLRPPPEGGYPPLPFIDWG